MYSERGCKDMKLPWSLPALLQSKILGFVLTRLRVMNTCKRAMKEEE
jgi:hypothetical protein